MFGCRCQYPFVTVRLMPQHNRSILLKQNDSPTSEFKSSSVRIPKAGAMVADHLRQRILRGELEEGANLPQESELVQQFGVSRPTLREAFRLLEAEGMLTISRGARGGAVVHRPNIRIAARYMGFILQANAVDLDDVYATRLVVEPAAVRLMATNASATAPAVLREALAIIESHLDNDAKFGDATADFHLKLVELSGVRTLYFLVQIIHNVLALYISAVTASAGSKIDTMPAKRKSLRAKERLIELIEGGKVYEVEVFWATHLQATHKIMHDWQPAKSVLDLQSLY